MQKSKIKLTSEETRRLVLATLIGTTGAVTFALSVYLRAQIPADWFYAGLGIGIAILILGNIRVISVVRQIGRAHQNDESKEAAGKQATG
jgi:hypothetical protein